MAIMTAKQSALVAFRNAEVLQSQLKLLLRDNNNASYIEPAVAAADKN